MEDDDGIIMHPSVIGWYDVMDEVLEYDDPKIVVDAILEEFFVPFISALHHLGWDCTDETFIKDFSAWLEVSKGVLYRRFDIHHPVQDVLDESK